MSGLNLVAVSDLARMANRAYQECTVADGGMEVLVEDHGDHYRVAPRGTSPIGENGTSIWDFLRDVWHDVRFLPWYDRELGWVPRGFRTLAYRVYDDVARQIDDKKKPIYVTGHSLGAATGLLVAGLLSSRGYNIKRVVGFGCPHTGRIKPLVENEVDVVLFRHGRDFVTYVSPTLPAHCDPIQISRHQFSENAFTDHSMDFYEGLV